MAERQLRQNYKKVVGISVMVSVTGVIISTGNSNNTIHLQQTMLMHYRCFQ